jgi:hypothetical protein
MKDLIIRCSKCNIENESFGTVEVELTNIKSIDGLNLKDLLKDKYILEDEIIEEIDNRILFEKIDIDDFIDYFGVEKIFKQIDDTVIERYIRKKKIDKLEIK